MQPIQRNKPVFFGDDGKLLANGKIYIGQPDKDPLAYPKTVMFRDNAGNEFQAGQPLRTNENGQIAYNGSAIVALVDGDYSMLIKTWDNVDIDDSYTARVSQVIGGTTETGNYIQYALTLAEVKAVNVQQGDVIENIGGTISTDGNGQRWRVQLPNGQTQDDINFINFTNGLQGARIVDEAMRIQDDQLVDQAFGSFILLAGATPSVIEKKARADILVTRLSIGLYDITIDSTAYANATNFRYTKVFTQAFDSGLAIEAYCNILNFNITVANKTSFRLYIRGATGDAPLDSQVFIQLMS